MNDSIVFMGSSRCHHHYIPTIIADTLQTSVYNAGLWGMRNIYFQYGLLSNFLNRYTPQTICLEIHPIDYLQLKISDIEKVGSLAPFIGHSQECDQLLKEDDIYYKCKLFHLYRYNSNFPEIIIGNLSQRTSPMDKGYKKLTNTLDISQGEPMIEDFPIIPDEKKIAYLKLFIEKCKEKGINIIFLYSPMYRVGENNLFDIPSSIAKEYQIPFINNYEMQGITGVAMYYSDYGHLNDTGAKVYSSMIASELKKYI